MKKDTRFALSVVAALALLSACKKDYSCKCSGSYLGFSVDTTINLGEMKKKDARSQCNGYQNMATLLLSSNGISGATVTCDITK